MAVSRLLKVLGCLGVLMSPISAFAADSAAADNKILQVCAVPQMHNSLVRLQQTSPVKFDLHTATATELYAELSNSTEHKCDVVLSSEERLAIQLAGIGKTDKAHIQPFAKVKLLVWAANPRLIDSAEGAKIFIEQKIKSIALAKGELTPVGYASREVLKRPELKAKFLDDHTYRADNEYQVYSMVQEGHVDAGFVTSPLVMTLTRQANGSYWVIPEDYYPTIQYYASIMTDKDTKTEEAKQFVEFLKNDPKAGALLEALGLYKL